MKQQLSSSDSITLHGVFMDVFGVGVLITGKSGIGKSELALGLINRHHRLVADDSVFCTKQANDQIIGKCSPVLQDFLEVRGLGILNIRALFGDTAIKHNKRLQLIVDISQMSASDLSEIDRLHGMHRACTILGIDIPEVTIPVAPGRSLSILLEVAVRNQILKQTGYDASKDFIKQQNSHMTL